MTPGDPVTSIQEEAASGRHPIQVAVGRTGLDADRIRQWERRYGAVAPERSEGGHRLYSDADIERLRLLHRVVSAGRRIGDVATLPDQALYELAQEDAAQTLGGRTAIEPAAESDEFVQACMERIRQWDGPGLESILRRAMSTLGVPRFIQAVQPVLARIGHDWQEGSIRPTHEHMASAVFRRILLDAVANAGGPVREPTIVVATPQGAVHDLGALMTAALASAEGWSVVFLGADLPASDLAKAAVASGARALAVSVTHPPGDARIAEELRTVLEETPAQVALIIGGRSVDSYADSLRGTRWLMPGIDGLSKTLGSLT
jgi:MerR family transcriptional regulator, light-induced transcriptional regulator